jgi:hypothetical protein
MTAQEFAETYAGRRVRVSDTWEGRIVGWKGIYVVVEPDANGWTIIPGLGIQLVVDDAVKGYWARPEIIAPLEEPRPTKTEPLPLPR